MLVRELIRRLDDFDTELEVVFCNGDALDVSAVNGIKNDRVQRYDKEEDDDECLPFGHLVSEPFGEDDVVLLIS